jgi:hypothetical protein
MLQYKHNRHKTQINICQTTHAAATGLLLFPLTRALAFSTNYIHACPRTHTTTTTTTTTQRMDEDDRVDEKANVSFYNQNYNRSPCGMKKKNTLWIPK